jgi:hypothetical protein
VLNNRPALAVRTVQVVSGEYRIFAGLDRGLYQSFDNGQTWATATLLAAAGDDGAFWSDNRGQIWQKTPASAKPAGAVTTASDASTVLATTPLRISRYGYGSARVYLPRADGG